MEAATDEPAAWAEIRNDIDAFQLGQRKELRVHRAGLDIDSELWKLTRLEKLSLKLPGVTYINSNIFSHLLFSHLLALFSV